MILLSYELVTPLTERPGEYARRMSHLVNLIREGDVGILEMNRPERKNAMDTALLEVLVDSLDRAASDDGLTAVVIEGAGDSFSAGADVTEVVDKAGSVRRMGLFASLYEVVSFFPKPLVAAITGACIGGGAEVASGCDLRVGTASSRIRFPGAQFGIPIGTARLQSLLGTSHAKDLLMTARTFDGDEAFRIGFFNRLVEPSHLRFAAVALAGDMAANPGAMVQKRLLAEGSALSQRVSKENRELIRWQSSSGGPRINQE